MKRDLDKDVINGTITFIESRLNENLKISELAEQSFFSKTHYQRLFHSIVGETVMEYVKKRRLQLALIELCDTKIPILEIALKYGYESHDGFTRAFKNYYGVTPSRYRKLNINQKNYYHREATKMGKVSSEAVSRIKTNLVAIASMMEESLQNVRDLPENIIKSEYGELQLYAAEVRLLMKNMEALMETINRFMEHGQIVFGVYGEIHRIIKHLDDIGYKTRLLKFLTGFANAGARECKDKYIKAFGQSNFDIVITVKEEFARLDANMENNANNMLNLIKDMVSLIRVDIKNDADAMIKNIIKLLNNAADEGKIIALGVKNEADSAGIHGKGLMMIANSMSSKIETYAPVIELLNAYLKLPAPDSEHIAEIKSANYSVEEIAFSMNILAFDAAMEAMRSPNVKGFYDCYHKIVKYARDIQQLYTSCAELFGESVKFSEILENSIAESITALTHKMVEDILLQGKLLSTLLGYHIINKNDDALKNLSLSIDDAQHIIFDVKREKDIEKCKEALISYYETIQKCNNDLQTQANTEGFKGITFDYIASEFDVFVKKVKNGIDCL